LAPQYFQVAATVASPAVWATKYEAAKSEARHTAAKRAVEQAYERLEALS
jgi:ATP-binding cassette subfamily F protein 3